MVVESQIVSSPMTQNFKIFLEPGDEVMADKGFPQIKSELLQR